MKDNKHKSADPVLDDPRLAHDSEVRLDTGMSAADAYQLAREWWETKGKRYAKQQHANRKADPMQGAFATLDPDRDDFLNSGLHWGRDWDDLTKNEKLRVIKTVHHHYVRVPNTDFDAAAEAIAALKFCWYCRQRGDDVEATCDEDLPMGESRPMCDGCGKERYPWLFDADPLRIDSPGNYDN